MGRSKNKGGELPFEPMSIFEAMGTPDAQDLKETRVLFSDFSISGVEIPNFQSRNELVRWRTSLIKYFLGTGTLPIAQHKQQAEGGRLLSDRATTYDRLVFQLIKDGYNLREIAQKVRKTVNAVRYELRKLDCMVY